MPRVVMTGRRYEVRYACAIISAPALAAEYGLVGSSALLSCTRGRTEGSQSAHLRRQFRDLPIRNMNNAMGHAVTQPVPLSGSVAVLLR